MSLPGCSWMWTCCGKRRRLDNSTEADAELGTQGAGGAMMAKPRLGKFVDLNKENEDAIQKLPGIGPKRAAQIVEKRNDEGGKLSSLRELETLPGFGKKTLEQLGRSAYVSPELGLHSEGNGEDLDAELRQRCGRLLLGSWNVRNLGRKALETNRAKDVAKIVAEYDVIALLELRDSEVIDGLLELLGRDTWAAAQSTEVGTDHHKEVYAFLYRTSAVELIRAELLEDVADRWVREPYMAHFRAPKGFDFILAAVHIVWGDTIHERRKEVEALGRKLAKVRHWEEERDVMLLGDFNLEPTDKAWNVARGAGWIPVLEGEEQKSMVGDTHLYDNIWMHSKETAASEWLGAAGVIEFDKVLKFGKGKSNITKNATKELSDHRPVWALFATDVDDDADGSADMGLL
eukprot:TRINITY_DN121256_c0_g1_i1.p1 TRINITY_DN121256_c0_g1~~TRINITY_DN121256_c0_g1_i1.p1  ORF type:complete len:403 (-),score=94.40 TRINITY_DN121256_c0_g1_i1:385-1593(-)